MFGEPIIETFQGGPDKGGARLTEKGHNILKAYQNWAQDIAEGSVALKAQFLPFD
jgi:molybdate transport repressor ModE-like protein